MTIWRFDIENIVSAHFMMKEFNSKQNNLLENFHIMQSITFLWIKQILVSFDTSYNSSILLLKQQIFNQTLNEFLIILSFATKICKKIFHIPLTVAFNDFRNFILFLIAKEITYCTSSTL